MCGWTRHGSSRLILRRTGPLLQLSPAHCHSQRAARLFTIAFAFEYLFQLTSPPCYSATQRGKRRNRPHPSPGNLSTPRGSIFSWGISKSQPSHCNCSQRNTGQYSQFLEHMARQSTFEIPRTFTQDLPKCFRNCIWVLDVHQSTHLPDRPWPA